MLQEETVQEVLARLARGEKIKAIARELGVDRHTVKRWRRLGQWRPRQGQPRPCGVDPYRERLAQRGPEVGWNAVVLHRELQGLGLSGDVQQVRRAILPWRVDAIFQSRLQATSCSWKGGRHDGPAPDRSA